MKAPKAFQCFRLYFVWFVVFSVFPFVVLSQNLRQIITRDGLSGSVVTCVNQSSDGMIWIGTLDGLNLYYNGKATRPTVMNSYEGEIIERIVETSSNDIWIQTTHGLHKVDRITNEVTPFLQFTGFYTLRCILPDLVAVCDAKSQLYLYNRSTKHFEMLNYAVQEGEEIIDMGGNEQYFWIVSNRGVYRYSWLHNNDNTLLDQRVCITNSPITYSTVAENASIIYIMDDNNCLYRLDISHNRQTCILQLSDDIHYWGKPTGIIESNGTYYISFQLGGVVKCIFHLGTNEWEQRDLGINSGVFQMVKDKFQNLIWIATDGQGLYTAWEGDYTFNSYLLRDINTHLGKPVRSLFVDDEEWLWLGTKGEGLLGIDRSNKEREIRSGLQRHFTSVNSELADNAVYSLSASKYGGFWVGTEEGLHFFHYADHSLQRVEGDDEIAHVHSIREMDNAVLWLSTVGSGVFKMRIVKNGQTIRLERIAHYEVDNGNRSSNFFFAMCYTSENEFWFGNRGLGLFKMMSTGLEALQPPSQRFTYLLDDVFALQEHKKVIWAGTGGGLLGIGADGKEHWLSVEDGLPNNIIHSLRVDGYNNLWIATNDGLARLDSTSAKVKSYGRSNGLLINEFSDGASFSTKDKVYFGGVNGWVEINRSLVQVPEKNYVAPLFFMTMNNRHGRSSLYANSSLSSNRGPKPILKMSQKENDFSISYIALDHVNANGYRYMYKVDQGQKGNWIDNGSMTTISLSNLMAGNYTLYLKYRNLTTGFESEPINLKIVITPYWWETTVMIIIYIMVCMAVTTYFVLRKYKNLQQNHQYSLMTMEQQHKEELYEEKLRFFTNITHELCTPLTLIKIPCEQIMNHAGIDDFVRKYTTLIMNHSNRLHQLIQELIDYRNLETKHFQLNLERCNLSGFVQLSCEVFVDWAVKKGVELKEDIEPDVYWHLDMRRIPNVIANLLSNAIKYTPKGGFIKVKLSKLSEDKVEIRVYNTGAGIKEEDKQRIFDRYCLLDNQDEATYFGSTRTGLGMAICYNSVKLLGGEIAINSEVGKYAEFVVTLPLLPLPEGSEQPPVVDAVSVSNTNSIKQVMEKQLAKDKLVTKLFKTKPVDDTHNDKPTILVVDDNEDILYFLNDALSELYQVKVAQSVDDALALLRESIPQLIITDVMMPGKDGIQLTQQIKQNKHTMQIPLIILSAKNTEEAKVKGIQVGADAYIGKPFTIQYLLAVVEQLLKSRKDMQQYYNSSACAYEYAEGQLLTREDKDFLYKLDEYVAAHLADGTLDTESMANALHYSVRNLYRRFKNMNLPSPKDYVKERRMEKVIKLLQTSDLTIQEIIFECGFNNRAHFYKDFNQRYGMTPKEYRKDKKSSDDSLEEE